MKTAGVTVTLAALFLQSCLQSLLKIALLNSRTQPLWREQVNLGGPLGQNVTCRDLPGLGLNSLIPKWATMLEEGFCWKTIFRKLQVDLDQEALPRSFLALAKQKFPPFLDGQGWIWNDTASPSPVGVCRQVFRRPPSKLAAVQVPSLREHERNSGRKKP